MLENTKVILKKAQEGKYAIAQFNINNLEWTKYILEVCNEREVPVILGVSEGAKKYMGGFNVIVGMVKGFIKDLNINVPVVLHLDHGTSFEVCKEAIDAGFTSVMIDGSTKTLEENIKITKEVVDYAQQFDVTVEGEVGCVGGSEDGIANELLYAKFEDCVKFVNETNVDLLAASLGSVHGLYKGEPKLDFVTMKEISDATNIPLVLHGGTGIPDDKIKKAISCGITKININTELQIAWHDAVVEFIKKHEDKYDPRKVIGSGEASMKDAINKKIEVFLNK